MYAGIGGVACQPPVFVIPPWVSSASCCWVASSACWMDAIDVARVDTVSFVCCVAALFDKCMFCTDCIMDWRLSSSG